MFDGGFSHQLTANGRRDLRRAGRLSGSHIAISHTQGISKSTAAVQVQTTAAARHISVGWTHQRLQAQGWGCKSVTDGPCVTYRDIASCVTRRFAFPAVPVVQSHQTLSLCSFPERPLLTGLSAFLDCSATTVANVNSQEQNSPRQGDFGRGAP